MRKWNICYNRIPYNAVSLYQLSSTTENTCKQSKLKHSNILVGEMTVHSFHLKQWERASGAVVAFISNARVPGSSPVRDKDFRVCMRDARITWGWWLTSFGWDDKPRSSVYAFRTSSTHYKDPEVSERKPQDCGNIQKPACTKVLKRENGMMRQWQHWPVSSEDVTPSENRPEHRPSAMSIR
jgi:hypothetical protein